MSILIIAEHNNKQLHLVTLNVIAAAEQLLEPITVLIIGYNCQAVAIETAIIKGVTQVYVADNIVYQHQLSENNSYLIRSLAKDFSYILSAATSFGKDLMPRVAAQLNQEQISDIVAVEEKNIFIRSIYAGNALQRIKSNASLKLITVRAAAFTANQQQQVAAPISKISQIFSSKRTKLLQQQLNLTERLDLSVARIVVAGGRGLQTAENFKLLEQLADKLGAAIGASRAAVDAGFVANDYQVGQTGKIIAPELYIACGISGAVQHLAGMKDSKIVVAINKDENAPIFSVADYAIVGDLFEFLAEFISLLDKK